MLRFLLAIAVAWTVASPVLAQTPNPSRDSTASWQESAWTPIVTKEGVQFHYIFYSRADNRNNGVVLRLTNTTNRALRYRFTVIFRAPTAETTAVARGTLRPYELQTGENDGLFWIPFPDGRSIGEIGLRGIRIRGIG